MEVLHGSWPSEFSHSLGQTRTLRLSGRMSVLPPRTDIERPLRHVGACQLRTSSKLPQGLQDAIFASRFMAETYIGRWTMRAFTEAVGVNLAFGGREVTCGFTGLYSDGGAEVDPASVTRFG